MSEPQSVQCCFDAVTGAAVLPASEQTHCLCAAPPLHPARLCFLESGKLATRPTVERVALGSSCAIWSGARNPQRQPLLTGWIMSEVTSFPQARHVCCQALGGGRWTRVTEAGGKATPGGRTDTARESDLCCGWEGLWEVSDPSPLPQGRARKAAAAQGLVQLPCAGINAMRMDSESKLRIREDNKLCKYNTGGFD